MGGNNHHIETLPDRANAASKTDECVCIGQCSKLVDLLLAPQQTVRFAQRASSAALIEPSLDRRSNWRTVARSHQVDADSGPLVDASRQAHTSVWRTGSIGGSSINVAVRSCLRRLLNLDCDRLTTHRSIDVARFEDYASRRMR